MMIVKTALLAAVCACVVADEVPKYSDADLKLDNALAMLEDLISRESSHGLSYTLLFLVVDEVASTIVRNCGEYEGAYAEAVSFVLEIDDASKALELAQERLSMNSDILLRTISPVSELITTICKEMSFEECDKVVDVEVKGDQDKYQKSADTLLDAGKLAELYLQDTYVNISENNEVAEFLKESEKGVIKLKDVINQLVAVKRHYIDTQC